MLGLPGRTFGFKYRALVCALLCISLCGFSGGLRGVVGAGPEEEPPTAAEFRYEGLSRVQFPTLVGTWLKQGKYQEFTRAARPAFPVPALAQGYIPQGLCYSQALGCFVITYYFYPAGERPSLLALVDAKTGERVKSLYLMRPGGMPYDGHAGGSAAWGEHVWVTSEHRAWRLDVEDLRRARDYGTVRFRDSFRPGAKGSIAFCADDTLWIGEYYSPEKTERVPPGRWDPSTGNMAWCAGFPLSGNEPRGVAGLGHGEATAPAYVLSLPDYVQGACVAATGELLLSTSHSTQLPSWLLVGPRLAGLLAQPPAYTVAIGKKARPLWVVDGSAAGRMILPPMSEGICAVDGDIYVLFESAALKYREGAQLYADYVFSLEEGDLARR